MPSICPRIQSATLGSLLWSVCCLASCGGSNPVESSPIALRPGRQAVTLSGFSFSSDPLFPPCTPPGVPRDGPSVQTLVNLSREGDEWVARSLASLGDLEIRLRENGTGARGFLVRGSVRGLAVDAGVVGPARDVQVSVTGRTDAESAVVDGSTLSPASAFVGGRVEGTLRYSDSQGATGTCTAVQWSMQPF
jgi:hypothetical protein